MKRAEVQLPDQLYHQVEGLAQKLHVSVPELLRRAAEQMIQRQPRPQPKQNGDWRFPEGRNLGAFRAPVEDWRLLANEAATYSLIIPAEFPCDGRGVAICGAAEHWAAHYFRRATGFHTQAPWRDRIRHAQRESFWRFRFCPGLEPSVKPASF